MIYMIWEVLMLVGLNESAGSECQLETSVSFWSEEYQPEQSKASQNKT